MHVCPMATPGTPPIPHVGGPILPPCCPTVMIGFQPAARVGDMATCVGPPDTIAKGSPTVLIGNMMAARIGDLTMHGGSIVMGCPTVIIGEMGMGSPGGGGGSAAPGVTESQGPDGGSGSAGGSGAGGSDAVKTDAKTTYKTKPSLDDLLKDKFVDQELKKAWKESNPDAPEVKNGDPGSTKHEQGGGIYWNEKTSELKIERVPAGTRDGNSGAPPATGDWEKVAEFHTHPNTAAEGYTAEPSPADRNYVKKVSKVPEIVETHDGRKTIPYR